MRITTPQRPGFKTLPLIAALSLFCALPALAQAASVSASSPNGQIRVTLSDEGGKPVWSVSVKDKPVIDKGRLGLRFTKGRNYDEGLSIRAHAEKQSDSTWEQPWGERRLVRDHHNELEVRLEDAKSPGKELMVIRVRIFDDGLGFRYELPADPDQPQRVLMDEITEFRVPRPTTAWWIPGGSWNRYEYLYRTGSIDTLENAHTPATFRLQDGTHLAIHEAALVDYSAMRLIHNRPGVLRASLAPLSDGSKAKLDGAFKTPWRTVHIASSAVGLMNSDLILNLNEPNKLGDVSWVKPMKYAGVWWGMHLGKNTWGSGPTHGASNENVRKVIDFAAKNQFGGVLVEGWNEGWDGDWFNNGELFNFTKPYPDFDLKALSAYAQSKGVRLVGHHETSANVSNYEKQLTDALDLYAREGVTSVKTGYVADGGNMVRRDDTGVLRYEWHDGQFAVRHHLKVVQEAAKRRISINPHEPIKDTGLRRTYPNWVSREGARGQEYNAWGDPVNPPEHVAILPFTRMLSGPFDYTPGIFNLMPYGPDNPTRVQSTLAQQLAHYVTIYSPIQMVADLPENYDKHPGMFQFIKDVPTDWENSIALQGEVGDFIVMARQRRGGKDWYLGALTDETAREVSIPLSFLDAGTTYKAVLYRDGDKADWKTNPYDYVIETRTVKASDTVSLRLGAGGGAAIQFVPLSAKDRVTGAFKRLMPKKAKS